MTMMILVSGFQPYFVLNNLLLSKADCLWFYTAQQYIRMEKVFLMQNLLCICKFSNVDFIFNLFIQNIQKISRKICNELKIIFLRKNWLVPLCKYNISNFFWEFTENWLTFILLISPAADKIHWIWSVCLVTLWSIQSDRGNNE